MMSNLVIYIYIYIIDYICICVGDICYSLYIYISIHVYIYTYKYCCIKFFLEWANRQQSHPATWLDAPRVVQDRELIHPMN